MHKYRKKKCRWLLYIFTLMITLIGMGKGLNVKAANYKCINATSNTKRIGNYTIKQTENGIWTRKGKSKYRRIVSANLSNSILCNGKYIYYLKLNEDSETGYIGRIRVDGKNNRIVLKIKNFDSTFGGLLGVYKNRIYYNKSDIETYCYNIESRKIRKIALGIAPESMTFYKNTIYYMQFATEATPKIKLGKMSLDGKNKMTLARGVIMYKIIHQKIYYVKYIRFDEKYTAIESFCRCNLNGKGKRTLVRQIKGTIDQFNEKYIWYSYYIDDEKIMYKKNIHTGKTVRVR